MHSLPTNSPDGSGDVLVEIIETLEAHGLENDTYHLHDHVDVDALEQLVASSDGALIVQFIVEGIRVTVSPAGVDASVETPPGPAGK